MPRLKSALNIKSEKELVRYRNRAKKGDFYEVTGAFAEPVFVPKTTSDGEPGRTRLRNEMRLRDMKESIKKFKTKRKRQTA